MELKYYLYLLNYDSFSELYESCDLLGGDPVDLKSALLSRTLSINSDIITSEVRVVNTLYS